MKTSLIIHGHFYQPPRENPYTGIVPEQPTAKPYCNWNESIYQTCYKPNAFSRYLDKWGRVISISNNYSYLSSNIGPTLFNWIDDNHPHFIQKLREAHEDSIRRLGHSNFIAQCYNHVILPLQEPYMQRAQIRWALLDYKRRFGTDSEGFWCSECAISKTTIDILAEEGVKFVILSPWQAKAIGEVSLGSKPAPCDRPFIIKGNKNQIAAFFYNPELASGISFGHMLQDADKLYSRLKAMKVERRNPQLINCATDGEIYGHHEPFGDMAYAALVKKIQSEDEFEITNYGAFLEKHPAKEEAVLSQGDDGLGSSWSCSHGVGRWYRDCGCHTGGSDKWNQKWRTPLRDAFRNLENKALEIYKNNIASILGKTADAYEVLYGYYRVLSKDMTAYGYVSSLKTEDGHTMTEEELEKLATLLEAMKNIMYMYTSCGWFFNDISGIEPRQDITYAMYAATLLSDFTTSNLRTGLLNDLKAAKSNITAEGHGGLIAKRDLPEIPAFAQAAGFIALNRRIAVPEDFINKFGNFRLERIAEGSMTLVDQITLKKYVLTYGTFKSESGTVSISIHNCATGYDYNYSSNDIPLENLRQVSEWVNNSIGSTIYNGTITKVLNNVENYSILIKAERSFATEGSFRENVLLCLKTISSKQFHREKISWSEKMSRIDKLASFVKLTGREEDRDMFMDLLNKQSKFFANLIQKNGLDTDLAQTILQYLSVIRKEGFNCDITEIQNQLYPYITGTKDAAVPESLLRQITMDLNFSPDRETE